MEIKIRRENIWRRLCLFCRHGNAGWPAAHLGGPRRIGVVTSKLVPLMCSFFP